MSRTRVGRWRVGLVATLTLLAVGLLYAEPVLLTGAAVPLAYVVYGAVSAVPAGASVRATRRFRTTDPVPGQRVRVELTVENTGPAALPDLRVVDGVPGSLSVVAGAPRACVALGAGESTTLVYEVVARRGAREFEAPTVRLRSLSGSEQATAAVTVEGEDTLVGTTVVDSPPRSDRTLRRTGTRPTGAGGPGLEFHATREYRPGDPLNRLDWRHYAKTGDLVTVEYRREQAVRTVVVVDARDPGRVAPAPGYPTGAELAAYAGRRVYEALAAGGATVSVTALGVDSPALSGVVGADGLPWVGTAADPGHADRLFGVVREAADAPAGGAPGVAVDGGRPGEGGTDRSEPGAAVDDRTERLLAGLPETAQVVVCSPLLDDWPVGAVEALLARGYATVVLSPDVTGGAGAGTRVAALDRSLSLERLERAGAAVAPWSPDEPVDAALERTLPELFGGPTRE